MASQRQIQNIALIGFMGAGKSSVGRRVAAVLRYRFVDTDELIEQRIGRTIAQIFEDEGEPAFRQIERDLVGELALWKGCVIATGGGLVTHGDNLARLKRHALVVCLWASHETIWQRVRHQQHRPLLSGPDPAAKIEALLERRLPFYRQADVLVNTEMRSIHDIAHQVVHHFQIARSRPDRGESHH